MSVLVKKFGGTSVGSIERIKHVANYLCGFAREGHKVVAVVSAMGQQTDELQKLALQLSAHPTKRELDMLLTVGERISMALLSIASHELGVTSLSLTGSQCGILTDNIHGNARITRVLGDRIREALKHHNLVFIAGFQGVSPDSKEITTLGRGGTDLSAVAIAHSLEAKECDIYTDVEGIYSTDPRLCKQSFPIPQISWESMCAMSNSGAKVLHARAAFLAYKREIPVRIKSSFNPEGSFTLIKGHAKMETPVIEAMTHRTEQVYLTVAADLSQKPVVTINQWLWENGEPPAYLSEDIRGDEAIVRLTVPQSLMPAFKTFITSLHMRIESQKDVSLISMIGQGFMQSPETVQTAIATLNPAPLATNINGQTILFAIEQSSLNENLNALHGFVQGAKA